MTFTEVKRLKMPIFFHDQMQILILHISAEVHHLKNNNK